MNSSAIVARILRILETQGAIGNGASLADQYREAVSKANLRLENVQQAIEAKQTSDAVRMMEEYPRLIDEVSTLGFARLGDWEELCRKKDWSVPPKLSEVILERVMALNGSAAAKEPYVKMYRKAVLTKNQRLAVQSLRRLVELDNTQDWKETLKRAEADLQKELIARFADARRSGDTETMAEVAQSLVQESWSDEVRQNGMKEVRTFLRKMREEELSGEGFENIGLLRRCMEVEWDLVLAGDLLDGIARLESEGWKIPQTDVSLVADCRKRCANEREEQEKKKRWKELCGKLHAAVESDDAGAVREALGHPEFLDNEPPEDLLADAQSVLLHDEARRRRKLSLIAGCGLAGVLAVVAVSGWWLKQKMFDGRCETEAAALANVASGESSIETMERILRRLEKEAPAVYADSRVNSFVDRLAELKRAELVRTNELAALLVKLKDANESGWKDGQEENEKKIRRAKELVKPSDGRYRRDFLDIESAWLDHREKMEADARAAAEKARAGIVENVPKAVARLKSEYESTELTESVEKCKAEIAEWRKTHQPNCPSGEADISESEKKLLEAETGHRNMVNAVKRICDAKNAHEAVSAREDLRKHYSRYTFVSAIGDLPVSADEVKALTDGELDSTSQFRKQTSIGISEEAFRAFIDECVLPIAEYPLEYSLYGIRHGNSSADAPFLAICKGNPSRRDATYGSYVVFDGEILDLRNMKMVEGELRVNTEEFRDPTPEVLKPCIEMKEIVDIANGNVTLEKFEKKLLDLIDGHLQASREKMFEEQEIDNIRRIPTKLVSGNKLTTSWKLLKNIHTCKRFPAIRRIQLMEIYLRWLRDDLKMMPASPSIGRWVSKITDLSQRVLIDGVPRELTWTCLRDERVVKRNIECAKLLKEIPQNLVRQYRDWNFARRRYREVADWEIKMVGKVKYDPGNANWRKDMAKVWLDVQEAGRDGPLYAVRKNGEEIRLVKAVLPGNDGKWLIASGMSGKLMAGEPLMQVFSGGKAIEAEEVIKSLTEGVCGEAAAYFEDKIPLFGKEGE